MASITSIDRSAADSGPDPGPVSDEELAAQALAAEADAVPDDAPCWWDVVGDGGADERHLPDWYMPAPRAGVRRVHGWRRWVVALIVASFVAVDAIGLCTTYGPLS